MLQLLLRHAAPLRFLHTLRRSHPILASRSPDGIADPIAAVPVQFFAEATGQGGMEGAFMNEKIAAAAAAMYAALVALPCRCTYNVPYADCQVKREVTHQCARCKSMAMWEAERRYA